jgi:hypothetical protein
MSHLDFFEMTHASNNFISVFIINSLPTFFLIKK